jgi:hypothetical protein
MFAPNPSTSTTTHKAVLPFYGYAGLAFLAATVLLFTSTPAFTQHHFHPHTLAITHTLALGWGTMMILGASHQLVPVLIEGKLYSHLLAYVTFILAAVGIPLLVYGFYTFNMGWPAVWGGWLVNGAILLYLANLALSIQKSKGENVHAVFIFTAAAWLLVTTSAGLLLVYNFTAPLLSADSLHYLSLHAHLGIVGWFLLLVIGVGSRLVPMFLISKYNAPNKLWTIYFLINGALGLFTFLFLKNVSASFYLLPVALVIMAIALFVYYCYQAYQQRIRKGVDEPMRLSLLSVAMLAIPLLLLLVLFAILFFNKNQQQLVLTYGFAIFFGWLTAIILGMTFKTLPFIAWNKVYHQKAGLQKTPNPKDLFNNTIFKAMSLAYISGFLLFATGILTSVIVLLQIGAALLLLTALLYNWNILKIIFHQAATP